MELRILHESTITTLHHTMCAVTRYLCCLIIQYKLHHIIHAYLLGTIVPNYLVLKYQMLCNATISELS